MSKILKAFELKGGRLRHNAGKTQTDENRFVRLMYSEFRQLFINCYRQTDMAGEKRIFIPFALSITIAVECSPPSVKFDSGLLCTAREPLEQTDELFLA